MIPLKKNAIVFIVSCCMVFITITFCGPTHRSLGSISKQNLLVYDAPHMDQEVAATGHHHGRVQIKVYRGPNSHGDHNGHFAPHGFWVKQPADSDHHR